MNKSNLKYLGRTTPLSIIEVKTNWLFQLVETLLITSTTRRK
ncbi:hypothetical protein [Nostoc sp.]